MMKKIFSKKSGFTLVEIVVAFAVFAIMAAMISQMLMMVVKQRQSNKDYADELAEDQAMLIAQGKDYNYDTTTEKTGTIALDFEGTEYGVDYQIKAANGDVSGEGLNYFVGNVNYGASGSVSGSSGTDTNSPTSNGAAQTSKYNTRITATKGINRINVQYAVKDEDQSGLTGDQVRYIFHVAADSSTLAEEDEKYEQMKLYFYTDATPIEYKDEDETYKKLTPYEAKIVEVGYVNGTASNSSGNREISTGAFSTMSSINPYRIEKIGTNSVRITAGKADNTFGGTAAKFYVVFDGDPFKNTPADKIAGTFGKNAVEASCGYNYSVCPVYDEYGADTGKKHVNIYGAYPYETVSSESEYQAANAAGQYRFTLIKTP